MPSSQYCLNVACFTPSSHLLQALGVQQDGVALHARVFGRATGSNEQLEDLIEADLAMLRLRLQSLIEPLAATAGILSVDSEASVPGGIPGIFINGSTTGF